MSQASVFNPASSPSIPLQFTTDSGVAVPAANNLNLLGAGATTTSGSGSTITIATASGVTWNEVTTTSATAAANNGYLTNNAGLVTITLPASAAQFTAIAVAGLGAGGWRIDQNAGQSIIFGSGGPTTTGAGGSLASTNRYDTVYLLCVVANTTWLALNAIGNLTIT